MRKGIMLAIGGLALLVGCGSQGNKSAGIPIQPKWKGAPYHIEFDTQAKKQNPAAITIPAVKYTANPEALETRAVLVMRFNVPGKANDEQPMHRMIGAPVDIRGAEGALPADYMDRTSKGLAEYLAGYCAEGKVNLTVALARSSLNPAAGDGDVDAKRLSDWLPIELVAKKPHAKC